MAIASDHKTARLYLQEGHGKSGRIFNIENGEKSPFISVDVFGCYQVTRDQVFAVAGAKEWFIKTYLALLNSDNEIGNYLVGSNA